MSSGEFARTSGLTRKALRLYDELSLLTPARVDPQSGYRFYAPAQLRGMGTTVTALLRSGSRIGLAHIGDTRAYLVRDGDVFQITRDHTVVQSLLDEGKITEGEVSSHPQRFLLMQALDGEHDYAPDLQFHDAVAGDRYLLSSDGLHACVSPDAIARVLVEVADPDQAAEDLVKLAMDGGGPDNVTCIVADIVPVG
jgi:serine/threonine protein phosphatase PrpC